MLWHYKGRDTLWNADEAKESSYTPPIYSLKPSWIALLILSEVTNYFLWTSFF